MPPKQSTSTAGARGNTASSKNKSIASGAAKPSAASTKTAAKGKGKDKQRAAASTSPEPEDAMDVEEAEVDLIDEDEDEDAEPAKTIPPDLLTRILHDFFDKDGTRITKPANNAVAKYMDVFVKEAIARAAAERRGGFLEVEDLEKIAPQLLLDL